MQAEAIAPKSGRVVSPDWVRRVHRCAKSHGIRRVRVFGSRAEGRSAVRSDLDLLVRLNPDRDLLDLIGFQQDLEDAFGVEVDVISEEGLSPYLRGRILRQARALPSGELSRNGCPSWRRT